MSEIKQHIHILFHDAEVFKFLKVYIQKVKF